MPQLSIHDYPLTAPAAGVIVLEHYGLIPRHSLETEKNDDVAELQSWKFFGKPPMRESNEEAK
jgi:hypothetical protein